MTLDFRIREMGVTAWPSLCDLCKEWSGFLNLFLISSLIHPFLFCWRPCYQYPDFAHFLSPDDLLFCYHVITS